MVDEIVTITSNQRVGPNIFQLEFSSPLILNSQVIAGQFVNINTGCNGDSQFLRRPFSIASVRKSEEAVELIFRVVGRGTRFLSERKSGDKLKVLGPLGKGFSLDRVNPDEKVAFIAGGVGMAPLLFATELLGERNDVVVDFFYGAGTSDELVLLKRISGLCSLFTATEDGSSGQRGLITDLFFHVCNETALKNSKTVPYQHIFCVGPIEMMRAVGTFSLVNGIHCEVSLEERMACAVGVCRGCAAEWSEKSQKARSMDGKTGKYAMVCSDGPVFDVMDIKI